MNGAVHTPGVDALIWNERWRLAALDRGDLVRGAMVACMVGLAFMMFHLQGNTTDVRLFGRSVVLWMIRRWSDAGVAFGGASDYSHGWLIPLVSLYVLWQKREALAAATKRVSRLGLAVFVAALVMHWLGAKTQHARLSLFALIGLLWGIPFYLYGWQVAKHLLFPCGFLIFCVPLNFLDEMTFPLRMLATTTATEILNGLGIAARRSGSAIYSMAAGGFQFDVADPCSGLRSLLAMTALTAVYAYLTQRTLIRKWLLFLCSIPLAIAGNVARITTVALVAEAFGQDLATGLYHDYSGFVIFAVSIGLMVAAGALINLDFLALWRRWRKTLFARTSWSSA